MLWKNFKSENMTFAVIGHLTQKLTYDGILQLTKLLIMKICTFSDYVNKEKFVLIPVVSN